MTEICLVILQVDLGGNLEGVSVLRTCFCERVCVVFWQTEMLRAADGKPISLTSRRAEWNWVTTSLTRYDVCCLPVTMINPSNPHFDLSPSAVWVSPHISTNHPLSTENYQTVPSRFMIFLSTLSLLVPHSECIMSSEFQPFVQTKTVFLSTPKWTFSKLVLVLWKHWLGISVCMREITQIKWNKTVLLLFCTAGTGLFCLSVCRCSRLTLYGVCVALTDNHWCH